MPSFYIAGRERPLGAVLPSNDTSIGFDPANTGPSIVLSNGNKTAKKSTGSSWNTTYSITSKSAGKSYFEFLITDTPADPNLILFGLVDFENDTNSFMNTFHTWMNWVRGVNNAGNVSAGATYTPANEPTYTVSAGDIIGIAVDIGVGNVWTSYNNSFGAGNPAAGTNPVFSSLVFSFPLFIGLSLEDASGLVGATLKTNGTQSFSPPSGFSSWS